MYQVIVFRISDKEFAFFGQTMQVKDLLKKHNARWSKALPNPKNNKSKGGWIVSNINVQGLIYTLEQNRVVVHLGTKEIPTPSEAFVANVGARSEDEIFEQEKIETEEQDPSDRYGYYEGLEEVQKQFNIFNNE